MSYPRARIMRVSIHALTRRATKGGSEEHNKREFQSTPSRGGRHEQLAIYCLDTCVSIHALTRRATKNTDVWRANIFVSIHALTRRATKNTDVWRANIFVSIHALTRRATRSMKPQTRLEKFQSTPSRGGRQYEAQEYREHVRFQSTPSRGGRPKHLLPWLKIFKFQSTPSRGGRLSSGEYHFLFLKFQSTPSRGGRHNPQSPNQGKGFVSIHALTRRATTSSLAFL